MPIDITPFTMDDLDEALALWQASEGIGLSDADTPSAIARHLARNPGLSFVARGGDTLVGTALCGHDGRRGYLYHLAVLPDHRRCGIGRTLVERCMAGLRAEGIDKCHLMVLSSNAAGREFWQRAGWAVRGDIVLMSRMISHPTQA